MCMLGLAWFGCLADCWVGCLFGSLVAWLAGWALFLWFFSLFCWVDWLGLSVWLAGWLADWLIGWSFVCVCVVLLCYGLFGCLLVLFVFVGVVGSAYVFLW